jgi:hypothetical protein
MKAPPPVAPNTPACHSSSIHAQKRAVAMMRVLIILSLILGSALMTSIEAQTEATKPSYSELLQELQPRMVIEVTEENLNNYRR